MKPKVYIETTIPSYLVANPSRDLLMAAHQELTHRWWREHREEFELFISDLVTRECKAGDPRMASKRIELLSGLPSLEIGPESLEIARSLISKGPLPTKAESDAFHIAVAAVNAMDYLLTWNMKHIANAAMRKTIEERCRDAGFEPPVICTPDGLLGEEEGYVEG
jgi:hypothetical protein